MRLAWRADTGAPRVAHVEWGGLLSPGRWPWWGLLPCQGLTGTGCPTGKACPGALAERAAGESQCLGWGGWQLGVAMVGGVDPRGVNGRGLLTPVSPECLAYLRGNVGGRDLWGYVGVGRPLGSC